MPLRNGTTGRFLYLCIVLFDGAWAAIQLKPFRQQQPMVPACSEEKMTS